MNANDFVVRQHKRADSQRKKTSLHAIIAMVIIVEYENRLLLRIVGIYS